MTSDVPSPPAAAPPPPRSGYPVNLDVVRPERQSRITNFPLGVGGFIRFILSIPHLVILYFLQIAASLVFILATFVILFSGRYPRGMFDFYVGYSRWTNNVYGYLAHLYDTYPPFSFDAGAYPLQYTVEYPERPNRLLNFPFLGVLIKTLLILPHWVVLFFLYIAVLVVLFLATFAILFTGKFPEGMHGFVAGVLRWAARVQAYPVALTDSYPPFSLRQPGETSGRRSRPAWRRVVAEERPDQPAPDQAATDDHADRGQKRWQHREQRDAYEEDAGADDAQAQTFVFCQHTPSLARKLEVGDSRAEVGG